MSNWLALSQPNKEQLHQSINTLHHASQFIASTGEALLPHKDDDSHTNMGWSSELQALVSQPIGGKYKLSLLYPEFTLSLLEDEKQMASFSLQGSTKEQVFQWLRSTFNQLGFEGNEIVPLTRYDIPKHEVANGAVFPETASDKLKELAKRRSNAHKLFVSLAPKYPYASEVRTWPHHFDLGIYIPIRKNQDQEAVNSIGLGMAIPDGSVDGMYFYVNHWSKNNISRPSPLPPLAGKGHWVTKDWRGAVLPLSVIASTSDAKMQHEIVHTFFNSAIEASLQFIGEA